MTDGNQGATEAKLSWHFPREFWFANLAELFERAAYYGMFIALALFLTRKIGFSDVEAGYVAAAFSSIIYLLPTFMGLMADSIGFRRALLIAFTLLTIGYSLLGAAPTELMAAFSPKTVTLIALGFIMFGGAIVKPVISGTVAKCSDKANRARAFSIFYLVVNIGAFTGKSIAAPLREHLGLEYINFYAASMAFCALIVVAILFRDIERERSTRTMSDVLRGFGRVLLHFRFMALILIVAGFWAIQGQLYATMPKYILRLLGEGAKPEWLVNINPFIVVLLVVPITHLIRKYKPENAIAIGLFIMPIAVGCIALSPALQSWLGNSVSILGMFALHPITLTVSIGIALIGFAECFLSPKFLEYASFQAPKGEEGLYLGYQHLTTFFAWAFGFAISGHLLELWCPNPETLSETAHAQWQTAIETGGQLPEAYAHAHYIWLVFAGIGVAAFIALWVFKFVTDWIDRGADAQPGSDAV